MRIKDVPRDSEVIFKKDVSRTPYTFLRTDGQYAKIRTYDARVGYVRIDEEVELV